MVTLLIDNYDSYTYIIFQYLWEINGERPIVIKNDALDIKGISGLSFDNIVISPGPGTPDNPDDVGLSMAVFDAFPDVPILGICLGHQSLGKKFGGVVERAPKEVHGKYSEVRLADSPLFNHLPPTISVVRYHSLIVNKDSLPSELKNIAETVDDGLIMGLQHSQKPFFGLQFHPESIGTPLGKELFRNFKRITECWINTRRLPDQIGRTRSQFKEFRIDWKDPESIYETLYKNSPYAFWLDSSMPGYNGRYSFMGLPEFVIKYENGCIELVNNQNEKIDRAHRASDDLFGLIKEYLLNQELEPNASEVPFKGGFVGYFGYETTTRVTSDLRKYPSEYPEVVLFWVDRFLAFDHLENKLCLCHLTENEETAIQWVGDMVTRVNAIAPNSKPVFSKSDYFFNGPEPELHASQSKEEYIDNIYRIKEYLKNGETYEVCLSNEFVVKDKIDSFELYKVLRMTNPAPYSAFIQLPGTAILSSSPECFITIDPEGKIKSEPIKGTRLKGDSALETEAIRNSLSNSEKDHSELLMIIDLIRNDLAICCDKGSVDVADFMKITEYATVLQMSSVIEGRLRKGISAVDVLKAAFPGGSITGAPKKRTMEIIDKLEKRPRGVYTGCIGYFSTDRAADFNIAIRTIVNHELKEELSFGSGGAIISESDPEDEYNEIMVKAYALKRAICLTKYGKFENYIISDPRPDNETSLSGARQAENTLIQ